MRLNKFIANNTPLSRRAADIAIQAGRVTINGQKAVLGTDIGPTDSILLDSQPIDQMQALPIAILLNKPVGYVCSKDGQGSPTVYDLLPIEYKDLNIAGRLDKDSSGLVVLTNDGDLLYKLTHPSQEKLKVYEIHLDKPLKQADKKLIEHGIKLQDGLSKLQLKPLGDSGKKWQVTMHEGRNRQIRRTFKELGYTTTSLHRTQLASYSLQSIPSSTYVII